MNYITINLDKSMRVESKIDSTEIIKIAKFMGIHTIQTNWFVFFKGWDLYWKSGEPMTNFGFSSESSAWSYFTERHTFAYDYRWLMALVQHIEQCRESDWFSEPIVNIGKNHCEIKVYKEDGDDIELFESSEQKFHAILNVCIKFIDWYNYYYKK